MNYKILLFFVILMTVIKFSFSQKSTVIGFVFDKSNHFPVTDVEVSFYGENNHIVSYTDSTGLFIIENIESGPGFNLAFSHENYYPENLQIDSVSKKIIPLIIFLEEKPIQDTNLAIVIKNQSVIYDFKNKKLVFYSDALNLNENSLIEDFISGLPALVKIDNEYFFVGDYIASINIDGKTIFSNNSELLLKSVPAVFIEKAEIYEDKSTRNSLSNFDDNYHDKAIKIYSEKEYKNSLFGRAYAGISSIDRWNTGGNINFFNNDRIFSIIYQTNNINNKNYSSLNLTNIEGNSNILNYYDRSSNEINQRFSNFFNSLNDFVLDQSNGINENIIFGTSYYDKFGKWKFHGEYFFDKTNNETQANFKRIYFGNNSDSLTYYENSISKSTNLTHRFKMTSTYNFDDLQNFSIEPIIYIQGIDGNSDILGQYILKNESVSDTLGEAKNLNTLNSNAYKISIPLTFEKKFRSNNLRTLLIDFTPGYYIENRDGLLNSEYFINWGPRLPIQNNIFYLDHNIEYNNFNLNGEIAYSEPVNKIFSLLASWKINLNNSHYNILTDSINTSHILEDDSFSLKMDQKYFSSNYGLFYLLKLDKLKITQGLYIQQLKFNTYKLFPENISTGNPYNYNYLPSLFIEYVINNNNYIKAGYERSVIIPNIQSTRNVTYVNNPLNLEQGNMFLMPSILDYIKFDYLLANKKGNMLLQYHFSASFIKDYIGITTTQETENSHFNTFSGYKIIGFENMNNFYSLNSFLNFNTQIPSILSRLDIFSQNIFSNSPSKFNETKYYTKENIHLLGLSLKSEISKNLNFVIASNSAYHNVKTTLSPTTPTQYFIQSFSLAFYTILFERLFLSTDIDNRFNIGITNNYENTKYIVWNASVGYRLLRDKSIELRLTIHDILNQNKNIKYTVTNTYVEELRTNNLKRYFLFSLIYHINITNIKYVD